MKGWLRKELKINLQLWLSLFLPDYVEKPRLSSGYAYVFRLVRNKNPKSKFCKFISTSFPSVLIALILFPFASQGQSDNISLAGRQLEKADSLLELRELDSSFEITKNELRRLRKEQKFNTPKLGICYHLLGNIFLEKSQFDSAYYYFEKGFNFFLQSSNSYPIELAQSQNNLGQYYFKNGDYERALEFHQEALRIRSKSLGEESAETADSYNNVGNCYFRLLNFSAAFEAHKKALSVRKKVLEANHPDVAISYLNLGTGYRLIRKYEEALSYYEPALAIRKTHFGESHPKTASIYNSLGTIYLEREQYPKAAKILSKALASLQKEKNVNPSQLASLSNNAGNAAYQVGDYRKSLELHQNALKLRLEIYEEQHPKVADSYNNVANCLTGLGDFTQALFYFEKALKLRETRPAPDPISILIANVNLGNCYQYMGAYATALAYYEKAIELDSKIEAANHYYLPEIFTNLGKCYFQLENYQLALRNYEEAGKLYEYFYTQNHPTTALTFNNLGSIYLKVGNNELAKTNFTKALNGFENKNPNHPAISEIFKNLAILSARSEDFESAFQNFDLALNKLGFSNNMALAHFARPLELLGVLKAKANIHFERSKIQETQSELEKASETYTIALNLMDSVSINFIEPDSRQQMVAQYFELFEQAIEVNIAAWKLNGEQDYFEKAFAISEKSKSFLLLENLRKSKAAEFAGIPDSLIEKERDLDIQIAWLEKKIKNAALVESENISEWENELFAQRQAQQALLQSFEKDFPNYYRLKYDRNTISLANLQKQYIATDQAMLEFFEGEENVYLFYIEKNHFNCFEIQKDFPLEKWINVLRNGLYYYGLANNDVSQGYNDSYVLYAHELYKKFFAPILEVEKMPSKLLIVPDGVLGYLPFEALLSEIPEKKERFKTFQYLIRDYQFSFSYSATMLEEISKRNNRAKKGLLAFAPIFQNDSRGLSPLQNNSLEVQVIQELLGGDIHIATQATLPNFLQLASDYQILLLATHGKADHESGEDSFLAFTEIRDSLDNENLYVRDLYNCHFPAELVVLSACETGIGEHQLGEGIISLARGFSFAGARSVVTTLWSVNDSRTAQFMESFFKYLKAGKSKDAALRQVKLDFIEEGRMVAHPFSWAGFMVIGEVAPLDFGGGFNWWFWGIGLGVLAVVFFFFREKLKG